MVDKIIGDRCTGCSACVNRCPKQAISFILNNEGFWYPSVSQNKCIHCNLCVSTCPILKPKQNLNFSEPVVYAAWNKNENVRIQSTSGGVFSALAEVFIRCGGCVIGARYCDDFTITHCIIEQEEDIPLLRQSKYAQSELHDIFREIRRRLKLGEKVLFCGTPCQSAGLKSFLNEGYSNLYTCDFICRGVISPKVYRKFLSDMSQKNGSALRMVQFKNKDYGWNRFSTKLGFQNETVYQEDRDHDFYMRGYLKHNLYLRPSCHECPSKSLKSGSDLTIGDFWGVQHIMPQVDDNKGISVVLVNSERGDRFLQSTELCIWEVDYASVLRFNPSIEQSVRWDKKRKLFYEQK